MLYWFKTQLLHLHEFSSSGSFNFSKFWANFQPQLKLNSSEHLISTVCSSYSFNLPASESSFHMDWCLLAIVLHRYVCEVNSLLQQNRFDSHKEI